MFKSSKIRVFLLLLNPKTSLLRTAKFKIFTLYNRGLLWLSNKIQMLLLIQLIFKVS